MAKLRLVVDTAEDLGALTIDSSNRQKWLRNLVDYLDAVGLGTQSASIVSSNVAVTAFSTLALSGGGPANNETFVVNGVTFTCKTSGATGNEFNIGADNTATAVNIAAAVNASATAGIPGIVTATSSGAVVTLSAAIPGRIGNAVTITESLANTALGNATGGRFNSGADSNQVTWSFGR